jgi:hypothetical protein
MHDLLTLAMLFFVDFICLYKFWRNYYANPLKGILWILPVLFLSVLMWVHSVNI